MTAEIPPPVAGPTWRTHPYRILFPLGILIAWAGVVHWMLYGFGWTSDYRRIFHSLAQVEGFMFSFALGFLFTAIPRRTQSFPPAVWEMAIAVVCPIGLTVAAWFERWAVSQVFWVVLLVTVVQFAVRRFTSARARRRPPDSFVWIPVALLMGLGGSVLTGVGGALRAEHPELWWLHQVGIRTILQGMFLGLVLGVGGLALPLMTRGQGPPDMTPGLRSRLARAGHLGAAALVVASFWVDHPAFPGLLVRAVGAGAAELLERRLGFLVRGLVALVGLVVVAGIHRPPSLPGTNRRVIWLAAWFVPTGFLAAAAFPSEWKSCLHLTFIGGFAMMALAVGYHVSVAHSGRGDLKAARSGPAAAIGALVVAAAAMRLLVEFDRHRFALWIGWAATAFLLATLVWFAVILPKMFGPGESTT